ncbi:hypothetical protein MP228_010182 [Amoeboaphelidium protococcarum]|nr:hypothetical protein MP228_010182 [Amoeboaphelidium protococcarum]
MSLEYKNVRQSQLDALVQMLNLNQSADEQKQSQQSQHHQLTVWKVLIYDRKGQDVIAPLLRLSKLRELCITLHLLIDSPDRAAESVEDAPAIYFIEPTRENIKLLARDLSLKLYSEFYVNFSYTISRDLLEELAQQTINDGSFQLIRSVFDQYLDFASLEKQMFTLNLPDSYQVLNDQKSTDSVIEAFIKRIVNSLFCVCVTCHVVPIIRCQPGGAAEMVSRQLDQKLRDYVRSAGKDANNSSQNQQKQDQFMQARRPVLIILDRNIDLATMLHHTWSYQCMVHDLLSMSANRITFVDQEGGRQVKRVYDFDLDDYFWSANAFNLFPIMAENVDAELTKYKQETADLTRSCGVDSLDEIEAARSGSASQSTASSLKVAIQRLPELTQRKRIIDMHMNIASRLLKSIKSRHLDDFIVIEENLSKATKLSILELINSADKGSASDKIRMFIVHYLAGQIEFTPSDIAEIEAALQAQSCDTDVIRYVKSVQAFSKLSSNAVGSSQMQNSQNASNFLNRLSSVRESAFGSALGNIISGVKNILPASTKLPVTRIVESICQDSSSALNSAALLSSTGFQSQQSTPDEEYLFFDPKAKQQQQQQQQLSAQQKRAKQNYDEAFVFVVGGGNYVEYQNLMEYGKNVNKKITYGSTEIINADGFLQQLSHLGKSMVK